MRKTYLLLTLLLLCVGISIHAQVTTASMSGKVTDTSSEAMIGVLLYWIQYGEPDRNKLGFG